MALAAAQVGSVIGKGGAIVKQIRENTGTRVRVVELMPGSDDRVIVISGLEDPQLDFHGIQVLASDRKHSTPESSTIWDILRAQPTESLCLQAGHAQHILRASRLAQKQHLSSCSQVARLAPARTCTAVSHCAACIAQSFTC